MINLNKIGKANTIFAEILEEDTIIQFTDALSQPTTIRGALMPDAHLGYTLPIGAVIETNGMIFPSYVGFDIGCTDCETEFLTKNGWKCIDAYNNEEVMIYDDLTNSCHFDHPKAYIINDCENFWHLKNKSVDQMLTGDHRVILFPQRNPFNSMGSVAYLETLIDKNKALAKGITQGFKTIIPLNDSSLGLALTDDEIRMIVAISADGCIRAYGSIEFHMVKTRKITRLKMLVKSLGLVLKEYNIKDGSFACSISFYKAIKNLDIFWKASARQLCILAEEVRYWDGHIKKDERITYSTSIEGNAQVVQYAFSVTGFRTNIHKVTYKDDKDWAPTYTVYTTKNILTQFPNPGYIQEVPSKDGKSYCFYTATGYWVMRRGGKIAITGNCGVCAAPIMANIKDIRENANKIQKQILLEIPVGFQKHKKEVANASTFLKDKAIKNKLTHEMYHIYRKKQGNLQLGTLGQGNHFIEVGVDETERVWVIIHSGSRGIGHGCATHYMKLAHPNNKAGEGHYGFDVNSFEGKNYIKDLDFCLDYALLNRKIMINLVVDAIEKCGIKCYYNSQSLINRNHNHAETKDGKKWIHRKGATHAEKDMLGVIPGNMRDGSFIVKGLGNPDSLCSSSHGAGRILGRKKAKESLDMEEFTQTMQGIVANVSKSTLDESPMAYKNIFEVMKLQKNLVEVINYVKPILNVKG